MHPFYGPSSQLFQEGESWWLGLASMAMYLLFWAVVIVIAVKMFKKYIVRTDYPKNRNDNAMSILRERYAKGEIDAEEFKRIKADLEETSGK
ncbi:SHOCT domain-containing protein [Youngiibacter multivorans]|uniref:Membrane protein n=1 Tax=Youngiibacter multivorans TaxID=937251 RepID=A0ABS4G2J8_9CLOT|nr:SHOCT domain-containing protein [Youngiibacter multivorans]MBP1918777.1 putative membrane protein [Youngiibacter multivorans]